MSDQNKRTHGHPHGRHHDGRHHGGRHDGSVVTMQDRDKHYKKVKRRKHSQWLDVWYRLRKNKLAMIGMVIVAVLILVSVFAPVLTPYEFDYQSISERFQYPCLAHPFGTDNLGRDTLTRILYGGRTSLLTSVVALMFSIVISIVLGTIAGFFGGTTDIIIMRILDIIGAVPSMMLAITISAALGNGVVQTAIAIGIGGVGQMARLIRGSILQSSQEQYVESAISTGSGNIRIMFKQVLPNVLSPLIISASMGIGSNIAAISGLSFIGLGVQPPIAEWGNLMNTGMNFIREYWPQAIFPGLVMMVTLFAFNCFGDGLRDALDPKLKQ